MFWFGFCCGALSVVFASALIMLIALVTSYRGEPLAEDDEFERSTEKWGEK